MKATVPGTGKIPPRYLKNDLKLFVIFIVLIVGSIILEWYGHQCRLIFTPDSFDYLSASKSFRSSFDFLDSDGKSYFLWPPLFPVILSFFDDPQQVLIWIHLFLRIVIGGFIFFLAQEYLTSLWLRIIFMLSTIGGVHFMMISVFFWSEMIFVAIAFSNLYCAIRLDRSRNYFYLLLFTGFLLCIQRNAGLFWVAGVSVWILHDVKIPVLTRIVKALLCFLISTSGFWFWNLSNAIFVKADHSVIDNELFKIFFHNVGLTLQLLSRLILPLENTVGLLVFLIAIAITGLTLRRLVFKDSLIQLVISVLIFYGLGIIYSIGYLEAYESEIDRFFAPVVPLIYLVLFTAIEKIYFSIPLRYRSVIFVLLLLWSFYPIARTINNTLLWHKMGCEF